MKELARPIRRYLHSLTVRERKPAFLCADREGRLRDWGGALESYGIAGLKKGEHIGQQVYFLEGLFPLDSPQFLVPCVETESEVFLDIHLFRAGDRDWALLLDAAEEAAQRLQLVQSTSPGSSASQMGGPQRGAFWAEELGRSFAARLSKEDDLSRRATVVFAGFEGPPTSPGAVRQGVDSQPAFPPALKALQEGADMFVAADGDVAIAVFEGESSAEPERCAVEAALSAMSSALEAPSQPTPARVGIAMASGPQSALKEMISFAARLQNEAAGGEILIDRETFEALPSFQTLFSEVQLHYGVKTGSAFSHVSQSRRGQS